MLRHIAEVQENTDKQIEGERRTVSTSQQIEATQHEIEDFRDELKKLKTLSQTKSRSPRRLNRSSFSD
jgi:rubrerythrin